MWRDALFGTRKEKATQWLFIDFDGGVASGKGKVGDGEREVVCVRRMQWDVELFCRMRWTTGIGTTVKHELNNAMHVLHNFLGFDINTTAFCLGQYSIHLLLLKSSMVLSGSRSSSSSASSCPATFMIQFDTINLAKFRPLPIFLKVYLVFCKTLN